MNLPRWNPGDKLSLARLNAQRGAALANARTRPAHDGGSLAMNNIPSGHAIRLEARRPIVALLAGSSSPYSFTQALDTATGFAPAVRAGTAYEVNGVAGLGGKYQRLYPDRSGSWRFQDVRTPPPSGSTYVTVPFCQCTSVPTTLKMTSADSTCNYRMFQSCTIAYGPPPASLAKLNLGRMAFLSTAEFYDPVSASNFYYYLFCQYNGFYLTRVYPMSPYGSPYQDAVLYTWYIGGSGQRGKNTCSAFNAPKTAEITPFALIAGSPFPGSACSPGDPVTITE